MPDTSHSYHSIHINTGGTGHSRQKSRTGKSASLGNFYCARGDKIFLHVMRLSELMRPRVRTLLTKLFTLNADSFCGNESVERGVCDQKIVDIQNPLSPICASAQKKRLSAMSHMSTTLTNKQRKVAICRHPTNYIHSWVSLPSPSPVSLVLRKPILLFNSSP